MLREVTWPELQEIYAYSEIEPFGEEREDLRAGIVASAIVNILIQINSNPKKGRPKLTKPQDFMPKFDEETKTKRKGPPKSSAEIMAGFKSSIYKGLRKQPPANEE